MAYSGGSMVYSGLLDEGTDMVTLVDALVEAQLLIPVLEQGKDTKVLYPSIHSWNDYFKLVDVCCGIGGVAHGALDVGVRTTASAVCKAKMLELHEAHSGTHGILGNVGDPSSWCGCPQPNVEVLPTAVCHGKLMDISRIDAGGPMTVVSKVEVFDCRHERHLLCMVHNGACMVFRRLLDGGSEVVKLLDAAVVTQYLLAALTTGPDTMVLHQLTPSWNDYVKLPDVCCGLDVAPSDQWRHGNGSDGLLAASSYVVLSTQCRQNGLPSEELGLNGHGGLGTSLHVCGRGQAMAMVIEQIRLPMAMYTILGFSAALTQCHVVVAGKVRLLTHLLFLSVSRIRVACHPGRDRGGSKFVAAILAGLCCLATFVIDHVTGACLWALCVMRRWLLLFSLVPFRQLSLPWDGLLVSVPVTVQSQPK